MAAPVDAGRAATNIATAVDPWTINLPASIASGDILIALFRATNSATINAFTGWTLLASSSVDASDDIIYVYHRFADGTEGTTASIDWAATEKGAAIVWRITGGDTSVAPTISAITSGTSTIPDPGSVSINTGRDHLILWLGGWEGEQTSPPAGNPTNYSNPIGADSGTAGAVAANCRVAGATRQLIAGPASEDPGSWTISASDDWMAWTVAIRNLLVVDADAEVSFTELEIPTTNANAEVSHAEVEIPFQVADAEVSWAEVEFPLGPAQAEVTWTEVEIPFAGGQAQVSWAELEVPTARSQGEIAHAQFEVPDSPGTPGGIQDSFSTILS